MSAKNDILLDITPRLVLDLYKRGIFPMAESADDPNLLWIEPRYRGVLFLEELHVPRRLRRTVRQDRFTVRVDRDFASTIDGCAGGGLERPTTWINTAIRQLFGELFKLGNCHTVEVYLEDRLVGGLYGVSLGGVFFGESMFSVERDASKVAFVHLVARLVAGGYTLLDTQFITEHLMQFGVREVPRQRFMGFLESAVARDDSDFLRLPGATDGETVLAIVDAYAATRARLLAKPSRPATPDTSA
ncbi:MAG: leucyl/phenylalanyl-tRNA--protein transferase [Rhizobiales bacterium]|nr:leucyl/phenylalanyl-tRNA--protein transferase [Hyphomicrobiales bacterium]